MDTLTCRYRYTLPAAPTQRQPLKDLLMNLSADSSSRPH
jgi:hypothetical protein